jgi:predicted O-linked N-acetylglucosamine transferase (SPINDLY family)/glycosyltransferase involved in cell wall biosynthesis
MTILLYHKIHPNSPTMWWVSVDEFYRQMLELKSKNVVYLDDYNYQDPNQFVITFDGIYKNVLDYAVPILREFEYPFELFLSSDYIDRDNSFDHPEPSAQFVSLEDLKLLVQNNGRLQWHTKSHSDLTKEQDISNIIFELEIPLVLRKLDSKGFNWFAYPYGNFNQLVIAEVNKMFVGALSCHQGNDTDIYCLNRITVTNKTTLKKASIAVIIASYNYGAFLVEAIESVLRQTRMPDEILITDDASDDNTYEIAEFYHKKYPYLIKINRNDYNLGIVKHFNKAVSLIGSDYITILGADNRYRSDFIEKTSLILDQDQNVGIAYSDFALFGPRAKLVYDRCPPNRHGLVKANNFFIINFPDFDEAAKQELLTQGNFIHGSSMFRRQAFYEVGGYIELETVPEDYNLFLRIVKAGWNAKRIPFPILEYRQHSKSQANIRLTTFAELQFYKHLAKTLHYELQQIQGNKTQSVYENKQPDVKFEFDLTDINLIIFPDWQQAEELLYKDLLSLLKSIINHPEKDKVTLLIDNSGISEEDANYIISDVVLNLLQQEDFDVAEEANITLVGNLNIREWKTLLSQTTARILLRIENKSAIAKSTAQKIPVCSLANIGDIQLASFNSVKSKSDFISKLFTLVDKYQREPSEPSLLIELRQMRKQMAEFWLSTETIWLARVYLSKVGEAHQILLNHGIQHELLTETEQSFVDEILAHIAKGFGEPKAIQYLLVAMLYCRSYHLPLSYEISFIPDWLLNDYVKYLFNSQTFFQKSGEADSYYRYMHGWVNYLHTSILSEHDSILWNDFVEYFVTNANFIPLYFNEANLKDIYVKRAEIIEYFLRSKNYKLDYGFTDRYLPIRKIRIGILAAHFLPSSETFAYLPVYEYLSRDFEVILYSCTETGHPLEQYSRSCANSFKVLPQDLAEQTNTIRADDLDILFIATNVTAVTNQICLLLMHRLARIQATSGGSVVTTGMRHIDYYISGTLTDPSPIAAQHYREKLVKLEGSAHCFSYGSEQEDITLKVERKTLGITEDAVIFISGANYFKIIPELIKTWAKIIIGVPNSVLVLLPFGPNWSNAYPKKAFVNHLSQVFTKHRIPLDRLIVLDPQPAPNREEVKAYFSIADVYLDSYPFAGTTSLVEPLQVNLPVIARRGNSFRSAMGAAMLQALDVSDLVADSEESYIQLAIALGINSELRQQKSAQIKEKMQGNPSFLDSRAYSAKIGSLFQELFSKYLADTLSQNFRLRDINLIIFPDWSQPEDLLYQDLVSVISTLTTHPDKSRLTLLIDTQNIFEEEADMLLSSLTMNLLMEEDVDITDGPEISLLGKISDAQWKTLLPRINTRIALAIDNQSAIAQAKAGNLPFCDVDSLNVSKLEMTPI